MPRKEFSILLAIQAAAYRQKMVKGLKSIYTIHTAKTQKEWEAKIQKKKYSMVLLEGKIAGEKVASLEKKLRDQGTNVIVMVKTAEEKKRFVKKLKRYRAMDYIVYEANVLAVLEKVHKVVRWTILQNEVAGLSGMLLKLSDEVGNLEDKIDSVSKNQ